MVEIGGKPMLWHIMNIYAAHGVDEFIVALGYRAEVVKEYFLNFYAINNDISIDLAHRHDDQSISGKQPQWKVHLVDTGADTQTGGRVRRLRRLARRRRDVHDDLRRRRRQRRRPALLAFHKAHGRLATVTTVRPPARFGGIVFDGERVSEFTEKPQTGEGWINGGFFVLDRRVLDYIDGDDDAVGTRAAGAAGGGRRADGVSARRVLAADGYACASGSCSRSCGRAARRRGRYGSDHGME